MGSLGLDFGVDDAGVGDGCVREDWVMGGVSGWSRETGGLRDEMRRMRSVMPFGLFVNEVPTHGL